MTDRGPVELTVVRMGRHGEGVATLSDGRVAFVSGALPGERVQAEVTEEHKNFVRARALSIAQSSPHRETPVCPVFDLCGGCAFQHWSYASELAYKQTWVRESLSRVGHLKDIEVRPIIGAAHPYGYRNKGQFPWGVDSAGKPIVGLYARGSHRVTGIQSCAIQSPVINRVVSAAAAIAGRLGLSVYRESTKQGTLRHLLVRSSKEGNRALAALVVRAFAPELVPMAEALRREVPELIGVVANVNGDVTNRVLGDEITVLSGSSYLVDSILDQTFRISARTFFQVNPEQVEFLYGTVREAVAAGADQVWDLYAGVGTLACLVASKARTVWAVEVNPDSVADAKVNIALNRLGNVRVELGSVEQVISEVRVRPDSIIVDPPRSGLHPSTVDALLALEAPQLMYVSCNPNTLARDLERLQQAYEVDWVQPVDMFPRTDHVESCTVLRTRRR